MTYEEMRNRIPALPHEIYKCPYCGFYVESDNNPNHPTSTMSDHQEQKCTKAKAEAARSARGSPQIRIHPISDVDEIREKVISNLPRISRCKLCATELNDPTAGDEMRHLLKCHESELYEIR